MWYDKLLENDKLPDTALRLGIRKLCKQRLDDETLDNEELQQENQEHIVIEEIQKVHVEVNPDD